MKSKTIWYYHWCPWHGYCVYHILEGDTKPELEARCLICALGGGHE